MLHCGFRVFRSRVMNGWFRFGDGMDPLPTMARLVSGMKSNRVMKTVDEKIVRNQNMDLQPRCWANNPPMTWFEPRQLSCALGRR